jgi:hypothetical protein
MSGHLGNSIKLLGADCDSSIPGTLGRVSLLSEQQSRPAVAGRCPLHAIAVRLMSSRFPCSNNRIHSCNEHSRVSIVVL